MVSIVTAARDLGRLREISVVLARHGFGELAQRLFPGARRRRGEPGEPGDEGTELGEVAPDSASLSPAQRLRQVAMDLGPSFVKLGQIASTRPDLLPSDWIAELKKLQDEVRPLAAEDIRAAIVDSLGTPLEELFESFEDAPLAAASIGQVHRAVLRHPEGPQDVVVKVQRPGIRATVASDLELLHTLARWIESTVPEARTYCPRALVEQFDRAITDELDFVLEAENAERFARNFEGSEVARFPRVYREASSRQVLTLERLPGHKVYEAIGEHGHSGPRIARAALGVIIKMIYEDGFFHADPHPGNILIAGSAEHPVLGFIDLGMVGRLSPEMRDRTIDLMVAAGRNDHAGIADALYALGRPTRRVDRRAFQGEVARLADRYLNRPLKEIELARMISDLTRGAGKFGLEIPADFLLVGKALMTVEGVGKEIDPNLDVLEESRGYFVELLRKRYSPERLTNDLLRGLAQVSNAANELPGQTREILEDLRLGRMSFTMATPDLTQGLDRIGRRILTALVSSSFILGGSWMVSSGSLWPGWVLIGSGLVSLTFHTIVDTLRRWK